MLSAYICYSPTDGLQVLQVRDALKTLALSVREDVTPALDWSERKQALRQLLNEVDIVVIVLSPDNAGSKEAEFVWETARTLRRHIATFVVKSCTVPKELQGPHVYDLSSSNSYAEELLRFAGRINQLKDNLPRYDATNALVVRNEPYAPISSPSDFALSDWEQGIFVITVAVKHYTARRSAPTPLFEILPVLTGIKKSVDDIEVGILELKTGQARILARFDESEQRILSPILGRLDEQETALTAAILGALETRAFPAEELGQHLAAIHLALAEINARTAQISDQQITEAARQVAEIADDPGLDVKHKLKLTIPIVPLLLNYEGELELSSGLNLRKAWQSLRGWVSS